MFFVFCFVDSSPSEIYPLSLHDALPICSTRPSCITTIRSAIVIASTWSCVTYTVVVFSRSEEHTSELQSRVDLVCRLLLEKKKTRYRLTTLPSHTSAVRTEQLHN